MRLKIRQLAPVVVIIAIVLALLPLLSAEAVINTYTNSTFGQVDDSAAFHIVSVPTTDVIVDVNVTVDFHAIDGPDCAAPGQGFSFANEVSFWVVSPMGTTVYLVYNSTTGTSTYTNPNAPRVVVTFDDEAGSAVGGGIPVSGTFRPVQSLSAFDGENPNGTWEFHYFDDTLFDALCLYSFTIEIEDNFVPPPPTNPTPTSSGPAVSGDYTKIGQIQVVAPGVALRGAPGGGVVRNASGQEIWLPNVSAHNPHYDTYDVLATTTVGDVIWVSIFVGDADSPGWVPLGGVVTPIYLDE
ncbi:MAG: hypothetical protein L0154_17175 [Chloroflexi bacterium]|nr:hypothetical protein [Chloroflexota bacterium]